MTAADSAYKSQAACDGQHLNWGGAPGGGKEGKCPPMVFRKEKIRRLWVLSCVGVIKMSFSFKKQENACSNRGLLLRVKH